MVPSEQIRHQIQLVLVGSRNVVDREVVKEQVEVVSLAVLQRQKKVGN